MTQLKSWKILHSELIFNEKWCRIRKDRIELPNNEIIDDYFVRLREDIALVLPITQDQQVIFVRQYRHAVGKILLELPAGNFDSTQEDSFVAALREMQEETGYTASKLTKLATIYENPGNDTSTIHVFVAVDAYYLGKQKLDSTEEIEVVLIPIQEIMNKITEGEICVSGTVSTLLLGFNWLSRLS
ncbi:MAG: NUDIX hydrolase [Okeania sp. SIO2D1]|nr:NUDIX hydrolase [Okeania sp. SIO2D1]